MMKLFSLDTIFKILLLTTIILMVSSLINYYIAISFLVCFVILNLLHIQKQWLRNIGVFVFLVGLCYMAFKFSKNDLLLIFDKSFDGLNIKNLISAFVIGMPLAALMSYYLRKIKDQKSLETLSRENISGISLNEDIDGNGFNNSFLLGKDLSNNDVLLSEKNANTHTLVIGTTGAGKTNTLSILVEGAIAKGWPVIFVDGKGDESLGRSICDFAKSQNLSTHYFSMNKDSNTYYNPLASGDYTSKKDRIISLFDEQDEYYKSISEGYIQVVFKVLEKCNVDIDLYQLGEYMPQPTLINLIRTSVNNDTLAKSDAEKLILELDRFETATKDISSIATHINNICGSSSGEFFNTHGENKNILKLPEILNKNGLAYFKLPSLKSDNFVNILGKLIINDIKATLHDRLDLGDTSPVLIIFDEFSTFAGKQVTTLLGQGRSAGAHCVIGTQGFADFLTGKDGEKALDQMLQNITNFIVQQLGGYKDREICASLAGTKLSKKLTTQIDNADATHKGSLRDGHEFQIHPSDFQKLKAHGDAYFLSLDENGERTSARMQIRKSDILD